MSIDMIQQGKCFGVYRGHEGTVYSIDAFWKFGAPPAESTKNKQVAPLNSKLGIITLVTGSHDNNVIVWDVSNTTTNSTDIKIKMEPSKKIKAHTGDVYTAELILDEDYKRASMLITGGDYTLKLWNLETANSIQTFTGHSGYVACVKAKGKRVFSSSWDTTIRSWNIETGRAMHVFKGHKNIVNCLDVTDSDIYSGSWDMTIIRWSRATGNQAGIFKGHTDGVQCLQLFEKTLYSGSMDKSIRVWDINTQQTLKILTGHTGGIECLHVLENRCFSGSYDKTIRCFKVDTGECIGLFEGHTDGVYCLKIFNGFLFSGSGDKSIRVWDAREMLRQTYAPWWKRVLCLA